MSEDFSLLDRILLMKSDVDKSKILGRKISREESLYFKVKDETRKIRVCPNKKCSNKIHYPDNPQGVFCPTCDSQMTVEKEGSLK